MREEVGIKHRAVELIHHAGESLAGFSFAAAIGGTALAGGDTVYNTGKSMFTSGHNDLIDKVGVGGAALTGGSLAALLAVSLALRATDRLRAPS